MKLTLTEKEIVAIALRELDGIETEVETDDGGGINVTLIDPSDNAVRKIRRLLAKVRKTGDTQKESNTIPLFQENLFDRDKEATNIEV